MKRRWLKAVVVTAALVLAIAAAAVAGRRYWHGSARREVALAPARKGEFLALIRCRGELQARRSRQISAPVNIPELRILWLAPPNSAVKEGDVVIRFDASSARQQLNEKTGTLRQAQAALEQAAAQARITAEQDRRDLAAARYEVERATLEVSKKDIVSKIEGEQSRIELALAETKLRVQEATVVLHEASSKAKNASLTRARDQAQAEVELTKQRLAGMELQTPISGVIVYLPNYSQGWVNAKPFKVGDQAWPGATLAEIPDLSTLEMEGKIEEIDRGKVTVDIDVRVRVDALPELTFPAKLARISPMTQMTFEWPPTSSFRGYTPLEKPDPRLRPGMNGSMDLVVQKLNDVVSIPAKALFTRNGLPVVYRAVGGEYTIAEVKVLARNPDEVAIDGIPAGSMVALEEIALESISP